MLHRRREILAAAGSVALGAACSPLYREQCGLTEGAPAPRPRCERWSYDEVHHATAEIVRPRTLGELAKLLRDLSRSPKKRRVTIRGGGQSLDAQALNDDLVIELEGPEFTAIGEPKEDERGPYVTAGAAARWGDVVAKVSARGYVPYSVVTTSQATVGGTLSADCLSRSSPVTGREGAHVRSFRIVTALGRPLVCRRDDPDPDMRELFNAAIGGYGYLGAIIEVTFDLCRGPKEWRPGVPIRALTHIMKLRVQNPSDYSSHFIRLREVSAAAMRHHERPRRSALMAKCPDELASNPEIAWDAVSSGYWLSGDRNHGLLFRSRYVVGLELNPCPLYASNRGSLATFARVMYDPDAAEIAEELTYANNRQGCYVDDLHHFLFFMESQFSPTKESANRVGFRLNTVQQTFVLPGPCAAPGAAGDGPTGARSVQQFLERARAADMIRPVIFDVLYLPSDDVLLSANRGMCGYAVTLTYADRDGRVWARLSTQLRELSRLVVKLGGRVHLVKNVEADARDLYSMYGAAFDRFLQLKGRYDPEGILRNDFFDRVFGAMW